MSNRVVNSLAAVNNLLKHEDLAWLLIFIFSLPAFDFGFQGGARR